MFWGFPQRLCLQRWLSENQAPEPTKLAGASRPSMDPESPYYWSEPSLHPIYREIQFWPKLGFVCRSKTSFWLFWGPFGDSRACFLLSQCWRHNLWGKPQNISERYGWSGGVICRYFSTRNSCENKTFMKINTSAMWFTFLILSGWPCISYVYKLRQGL